MKLKKEENREKYDFTNHHELRVVGMSRSGNHSIINWIIGQLQGRYCFLNCAEPKTNPFFSARPLQEEDMGKTYSVNYPDFDLNAEKSGHFSQKDYLIHSYEDCFLGMLNHKTFEEQHDAFVGPSRRRLEILVIRDPFNLFASRKRSGLFSGQFDLSSKPVTPLTARRIWKQHAREALGEKKFFSNKRVLINYNLWAFDPEYRKNIAAALGLDFSDAGIQEVSQVAGGSSFDGLKYANKAHKMEVLERWKHYVHDQDFQKIFDEEMISLSRKLFGPISDQQLLSA